MTTFVLWGKKWRSIRPIRISSTSALPRAAYLLRTTGAPRGSLSTTYRKVDTHRTGNIHGTPDSITPWEMTATQYGDTERVLGLTLLRPKITEPGVPSLQIRLIRPA